MIRKCLQQVIKAATSTLTSHSRTAAYPHFRFSQQKHNFSLKDHLLEKEDNRKLSPSVSDPENTPQSESFEVFSHRYRLVNHKTVGETQGGSIAFRESNDHTSL